MGLLNFFKLKKQINNDEIIENYQDLENEYLTSNPTDNIYNGL